METTECGAPAFTQNVEPTTGCAEVLATPSLAAYARIDYLPDPSYYKNPDDRHRGWKDAFAQLVGLDNPSMASRIGCGLFPEGWRNDSLARISKDVSTHHRAGQTLPWRAR